RRQPGSSTAYTGAGGALSAAGTPSRPTAGLIFRFRCRAREEQRREWRHRFTDWGAENSRREKGKLLEIFDSCGRRRDVPDGLRTLPSGAGRTGGHGGAIELGLPQAAGMRLTYA